MGCGASKSAVASTIEPKPKQPSALNASTNSLCKPVIPKIGTTSAQTPSKTKAIAFEISVDGLRSNDNSKSYSKLSLPKLFPDGDLQAKLADTEARWKELNKELDAEPKRRKPKLRSRIQEDPEIMKRRLAEKEARAEAHRAKEIARLQKKLARHEEHARKVLERKKAIETQLDDSNNDLEKLSVGGEISTTDDDKIRLGSGRSNITDNTVTDSQESSISVGV